MGLSHFTNHTALSEAMVGFSKVCRENEIPVGLSHTKEAISMAEQGFVLTENAFRFGLKSLYCTMPEQYEAFDKCFDVYWLTRRHEYAHKFNKGSSNISKKSKASLVMMGFDPNKDLKTEEPKEEASNVTGASKAEVLKATDFTKISDIDSAYLDELSKRLLKQLNDRLKRRLSTSHQGRIHLRNTIRKNLSHGGVPVDLVRKAKKREKYKIVLLLDVSGSMDKYSFFLLKFIWSLKTHLKKVESFIFSTRLIRITESLNHEQLGASLKELSYSVNNWSGGTQIGECLKTFNEEYAKQILNGRSITIVLSDGLDTGKPETLEEELAKIKLRTSKLVWLNPLKGSKDYEPTARGMNTALPYLDVFQSAHNLNSLLELENLLAHV